VRPLAARALGDEEAEARERRRVVLDHLHVHQRGADPVGHGDPVPGADQGIRRGVVDLPVAARGEDHGLRGEQLHGAVSDVARDHPRDAAIVVLDQRRGEPLLVAGDLLVLHELLVEHVQNRLPGDVGDVVRPGCGRPAERPLAEPAPLVAVEGDTEVFEVEELVRRLPAHDLDGVLVAEVIRALDGVEGVRLPGILRVERCVDAALGRIRMRPHGMNLGDHTNRSAQLSRGKSGALARKASTDDQYVVLRHAARSLFRAAAGPRCRRRPAAAAARGGPNHGH
jgi:hypothetical protein